MLELDMKNAKMIASFRWMFVHFFVLCTLHFVICDYASADVPNDTFYNLQWGLKAIKAEGAWDKMQQKDDENIFIAIIDAGIDPNGDPSKSVTLDAEKLYLGHEDINPLLIDNTPAPGFRLWKDPLTKIYGKNYVEKIADYNKANQYYVFEYKDNTMSDNKRKNLNTLGTKLAGIVGAITGNGKGIAGITRNCKIITIKVMADNAGEIQIEPGTIDGKFITEEDKNNLTGGAIINGVIYAAENGADVILLPSGDPALINKYNLAVKYAHDQGCVIVAPSSASAAAFDNVIGVGSVNINLQQSNFSNSDKNVDVVAPGENILTTTLSLIAETYPISGLGSYEYSSRIELAAAHVAGYAALLFSYSNIKGLGWTNKIIEDRIINTAYPLGTGAKVGTRNNDYGYGLIDLLEGLDIEAPAKPTIFSSSIPKSPTNISTFTLTGSMSARIENDPNNRGDTRSVLIKINNTEKETTYNSTITWESSITLANGINTITAKAKDLAGNESGSTDPVTIVLQEFPYSDSSGNNTITFQIDSTVSPLSNGDVSVETYSVSNLSPDRPPGMVLISDSAIKIKNNSSAALQGGKTVTIKMKIKGPGLNPIPYYFDDASELWKTDGLTVVSKDQNQIVFTTTKTSGIFAVFDVTNDLKNIVIYPVPYKLGTSDQKGIVFSGLKGDETIKIYTLTGELVYSATAPAGSQTWTWEVKNSEDYTIAQDIYFFLISNSSGQKRLGKIAVIN